MSVSKRFVYVLKSTVAPHRFYTGLTSDVAARLRAHNAGHCPHTARAKPWHLVVSVEFADERRAMEFERYLKFDARGRLAIRTQTLTGDLTLLRVQT
jgi:putative endonuclease